MTTYTSSPNLCQYSCLCKVVSTGKCLARTLVGLKNSWLIAPSSVSIAAGLKADRMSCTHCRRSVLSACGMLASCKQSKITREAVVTLLYTFTCRQCRVLFTCFSRPCKTAADAMLDQRSIRAAGQRTHQTSRHLRLRIQTCWCVRHCQSDVLLSSPTRKELTVCDQRVCRPYRFKSDGFEQGRHCE